MYLPRMTVPLLDDPTVGDAASTDITDNCFLEPAFWKFLRFALTVFGMRLGASTSQDQFFALVLVVLSVSP